MPGSSIDEVLNRLHSLQAELEAEIDKLLQEKREQFKYTLEQGKVRFEQGIKAIQRHQKVGLWTYLRDAQIGHVLTAPFIYGLFFAFVLVDLAVTLYQHVCFRVYGIPRVSHRDYIVIDRHQLAYLNIIEKVNCIYCGYSNGLFAYVREIGARTEQYWCPIKHTRRTPDPHRLSSQFVDFGDAENYQSRMEELRREIASLKKSKTGQR